MHLIDKKKELCIKTNENKKDTAWVGLIQEDFVFESDDVKEQLSSKSSYSLHTNVIDTYMYNIHLQVIIFILKKTILGVT